MTHRLLRPLALLTFGISILGAPTPSPGKRLATVAHAVLAEARPAANATVPGPDVDVNLRFNLRIDRARSRLSLTFPDGQTITLKIAGEDEPDRLVARATGLSAGSYQLHWQVLALDGHLTRGDVAFHVVGT